MKNRLKILLNYNIIFYFYTMLKYIFVFFRKSRTAFFLYIDYIKWLLNTKKRFYAFMANEYSIEKMKTFKVSTWKHGVKYFIGFRGDKKLFIKTGGRFNLIPREKEALEKIKTYNKDFTMHFPNVVAINADPPFHFIAEEFIEGTNLEKLINIKTLQRKEIDDITEQIFRIYEILKETKIKHMDIRPSNFIIASKENNLLVVLIDFGFAISKDEAFFPEINKSKKNLKILKTLGGGFNPAVGLWDDAFSTLLTLKTLDYSFKKKHQNYWLRLNEDIGSNLTKLEKNYETNF